MARAFSPEDAVRVRTVADPQISPDGRSIVYVSGDSFKASGKGAPKQPWSRIYIAPVDGSEAPRELTSGPRSDTTPRWSPDSAVIAFLSDRPRDGQRQVCVLPLSGGEARVVTKVNGVIPNPRSLNPLKWFADGRRLGFLMIDGDSAEETGRKDAGEDQVDFEADPKFQRVWVVDHASGETFAASPDGLQIWEFDISPDGRRIAAVVSDTPYEWDWYRCRIAVFEVGPGRPARRATTVYQAKRQVAKPTWSPDGRRIGFLTSNWSDRGVDAGDVMLVAAAGGRARNLTPGAEASFDTLRWLSDGALLAGANVDGGSGFARVDVSAARIQWIWRDRVAVAGWSASTKGAIATVQGRLDALKQVYVSPPGTASRASEARSLRWTKISALHRELARVALPKFSEVRWKAGDGLALQGFLATPPGRRRGRLPALLLVHGGPTSACRAGVEDSHRWAAFIAAAGIAVFMPNYRGSTGRGVKLAESNIGDMGGKDLEDMLAGLDHLVAEGIADPDRLGVAGWSYGGFTTMWAISQTDRFRAAVAGAGICDWRSFHGRSYLCTWDSIHYGDADPYDPEGPHQRFSAINYIDRVKTPTLILHGEQDGDVPVEQSHQFFRALKDRGVDTQLVVYPREPHGPAEFSHLMDINRRVTDWLVSRLVEAR